MLFDLGHTIRKLQTYNNSPAPILSVYFTLPEKSQVQNQYLQERFQYLIDTSLAEDEKKQLATNINYIEGYLEAFKNTHNYKGLALFSGGNNLWEVVTTQFQLPTILHSDHSPFLSPLLEELQEYQTYLIILADREKAKFFLLADGNIEEQGSLLDRSVPQKIHTGDVGSRQNKVDRHIQDHLQKHLKRIGEKAQEFLNHKNISSVIVGGHKPLLHQIEKNLPQELRKKIIGEFVTELHISNNEIMDHVKHVLERYNIQAPQKPQSDLMNA